MVWPFSKRALECDYSGTCRAYEECICLETPDKSTFVKGFPACYCAFQEVQAKSSEPSATDRVEKHGDISNFFGID